jgi:hypothetical protein
MELRECSFTPLTCRQRRSLSFEFSVSGHSGCKLVPLQTARQMSVFSDEGHKTGAIYRRSVLREIKYIIDSIVLQKQSLGLGFEEFFELMVSYGFG